MPSNARYIVFQKNPKFLECIIIICSNSVWRWKTYYRIELLLKIE